jgi:copper chaperone CopZ
VESTLKQFEGVQEAIVDIDNKRVALTYDPDKVELSRLEDALSEEGYDVADVR